MENPAVSAVLPYGTRSGRVYPSAVCVVLDAVTRAAAGRADVAATELAAPEAGISMGHGDAGPHTDFPGNLDDPDRTLIHGLNVHLTLHGTARARFAPVRTYAEVERIAAHLHEMQRSGLSLFEINDHFDDIYAALLNSACAPVPHGVGDMLIFQARPHRGKGLLPTVHYFESTSADRWHVVFGPQAGHRDDVLARRVALAPTDSPGDPGDIRFAAIAANRSQ
ncbi:hypothetical protein [Nocardia wallacei]|uniref:hypothetical protein n=1 Tax=Nocardia wallacei TaxID=480035 RepID=UPI0024540E17|nr:hypothetical protein [Nocardia wallacei]